ncbi:MAG: hypothetical protein RR416_03175 [Clostridia bacterium]
MASRGNKKKIAEPTIPQQETILQTKQSKMRSQVNFFLCIMMLLIFISLSLPITGVYVEVDAKDLGLEASESGETAKFSSNINGFSILLAPLKHDNWISYIVANMIGADGKTATNIANAVVDKALTPQQAAQMEKVFTIIFYMCVASWILWLVCLVTLMTTRKKRKDSFLPAIICFGSFLVFGLAEMILLLISFFSGTSETRLTVNVSPWFVLLLALIGLVGSIVMREKYRRTTNGSGKI